MCFFTNENYMFNSPCCVSAKYLSCARDEFKSILHLDPALSPDICTVFFPVNSAGSPDFSLGSQGLAALSPPTCLIFCVSLFLLHCQLSFLFKRQHIYDSVARVQKCRVHEVLPSEQELSCSCGCFSFGKQDGLGSLKQRVWDELGADIRERKRFCFAVAQASSNNISVPKREQPFWALKSQLSFASPESCMNLKSSNQTLDSIW